MKVKLTSISQELLSKSQGKASFIHIEHFIYKTAHCPLQINQNDMLKYVALVILSDMGMGIATGASDCESCP